MQRSSTPLVAHNRPLGTVAESKFSDRYAWNPGLPSADLTLTDAISS